MSIKQAIKYKNKYRKNTLYYYDKNYFREKVLDNKGGERENVKD